MSRSPFRGFTLVEVMVVIILAGVVTLGLIGFYLNSQATWIDGSAQALAQRDATTLLEAINSKAREAAFAEVLPSSTDSLNHRLILYDSATGGTEIHRFYWNSSTSMVHYQRYGEERGPVVPTIVERFSVRFDPSVPLIDIDTLRIVTEQGLRVQLSTTIALQNAAAP